MLAQSLNLISVVLCTLFVGYVLAILVPFLRRKGATPGDEEVFEWHAIVACLNEEAVLGKTVRQLRNDFPSMHVWVVDDDSDDQTGAIASNAAASDPHVHVVSRVQPAARQGKGEALNAAWRCIRGHAEASGSDPEKVIVCVLDADGRLDPDALPKVAGTSGFADPTVGAVQVQVRMKNRGGNGIDSDAAPAPTWFGRLLVSLQDLEFRTVIAAMQNARHMMHSAGMGGNGQFSRLSTLNNVAATARTPWHSALLEDFEFGLHVLMAGQRTRYIDDVWVSQEALPDFWKLVKQRTRWAQGGMQCIKYLPKVLVNRNLSTISALEIAYFLTVPWTQLLGTVVYVALTAMFVTGIVSGGSLDPQTLTALPYSLTILLLLGVGPIAGWGLIYKVKCEPGISWGRAFVLAAGNWVYSYAMLLSAWRAFGRVLRGRTDWSKTARVTAAPAA